MTGTVLGVVGHVDHGKTALVEALTGEDTDRLPEEKARGISVALGFARLTTGPDTHIDLIDMPGHERFVRTMVAGATGIDAILLVVAANEGIKPQTVEHVEIAALLGLRRAVVAVSKRDLVTAPEAARVADEAVRLLERAGLAPEPPVLTSAAQGTGLVELAWLLGALTERQAPPSRPGCPFLPIDRAFSVPGHGPVVTGTLRGGPVARGDVLELLSAGKRARVRGLQIHRAAVDRAGPGQRVAINLRDVAVAELHRGMAVAAPGSLTPSDWLSLSVRSTAESPPLKNGMLLRALAGTDEFDARLRLLDRDTLEAGQQGYAQLHCTRGIAIPVGEHVILRSASPARTVAGGRILDTETLRQKRHNAPVLERLHALDTLPLTAKIVAEVDYRGLAGATLPQLARLTAQPASRLTGLLENLPLVILDPGIVVLQTGFEKLLRRILSELGSGHDDRTVAQLLSHLGDASRPVLEQALARLQRAGVVRQAGGRYALSRPERERDRRNSEKALAGQLAELMRQRGLSPPTPRELYADPGNKRAVARLLRAGVLVSAVDRAKGREILFHCDAVEAARQRLSHHLRGGGLSVSEIGALLGISRKYSVPLLNYLDETNFTRRVGDRRVLCSPAALPERAHFDTIKIG